MRSPFQITANITNNLYRLGKTNTEVFFMRKNNGTYYFDEPPLIEKPIEVWYYKDFLAYIKWKYDVVIKPVKRQSVCDIPDDYI